MDDTLEVLMDRRLCWPGEDVSAQTHRRWRRRFWCVYCTLAWPTLSSPVTASAGKALLGDVASLAAGSPSLTTACSNACVARLDMAFQ